MMITYLYLPRASSQVRVSLLRPMTLQVNGEREEQGQQNFEDLSLASGRGEPLFGCMVRIL